MAFMEPEIFHGHYYEIETTHGTEYVPVEASGFVNSLDELTDYLSGSPINSEDGLPEAQEGWIFRLSAPGYMDCTEWCVADSEKEAREYLEEMYGNDDDSESE